MRRIIYILLMIALVLLLSACTQFSEIEKQETDSSSLESVENEKEPTNIVKYQMKQLDINSVIGTETVLKYFSDKSLLMILHQTAVSEGSEETVTKLVLYDINDGKTKEIVEMSEVIDTVTRKTQGERMLQADTTLGGNIYLLVSRRDGEEQSKELVKINTVGKEEWKIDFSKKEVKILGVFKEDLIAQIGGEIVLISEDGQTKSRIPAEELKYLIKTVVDEEGNCWVIHNKEDYLYAWEMVAVDWGEEQISNPLQMNFRREYTSAMSRTDKKNHVYLWNSEGIVQWNVETGEIENCVDFVNCGYIGNVEEIVYLDEQRFIAKAWTNQGEMALYLLQPKEEVSENNSFVIGCMDASEIMEEILIFAENHPEVQIEVREYSKYGSDRAVAILNSEMAIGNGPDVFLFGDGNKKMPLDGLIENGYLVDLYEFIDKDINREEYLTNIFEAYAVQGKLYEMPLYFRIKGYAAKERIAGNEELSLQDWTEILKNYPESTLFPGDFKRDDLLEELISSEMFWNREEKTCNFDSEEFIEYLEWAKKLPKEVDYLNETNIWPNQRIDKILLTSVYLMDFRDIQRTYEVTYGEDVIFTGFPGMGGAMFSREGIRIGINSQSGKQDLAWQFVKGFLSEEYQNKIAKKRYFPINKSVLQQVAEQATISWGEWESTYKLDGKEYKLSPITKEHADKAISFIETIKKVEAYDYQIEQIIREECEYFFEGQKTAEQVAKILQSRIQLMLLE